MAVRPRDSTTVASAIRYICFRLASLGVTCSSLSFDRLVGVMRWRASVLACAGGGGEREMGGGGGGVAGSGVGPGGDDQDDGFVEGAAPGVAFAAGVAFGAAVLGAGAAELAEGDGVAAGFGEEVATVAEHVRPGPEPRLAGAALAAELP